MGRRVIAGLFLYLPTRFASVVRLQALSLSALESRVRTLEEHASEH